MNDDGRELSCEIQVASGALVGVTRGPRRVRRGFTAFGAVAFAAGFAAAGAFAAGAAAAFRTSTGFAAGAADFAVRAGAAAGFFATGFEAATAFFCGAACAFGAAFAAALVALAGFFDALTAGFATSFGAAFTAFAAGFGIFGAGFAGFTATLARFGTAVFLETGFAAAFLVAGVNFLTALDLLATLLPEDFIRAVVVDVLLFARAIVHSLEYELTPLFGGFLGWRTIPTER